MTMLLILALLASWALFAGYHLAWLPFKRQGMFLKVAGLVYERGPVLLVGDSILAGLSDQACALNLAVPGMEAAALDASHASAISSRAPSRVVVLIGINDLRAGVDPSGVALSIAKFMSAIQERQPQATILVLSILPIIENEITLRATNAAVKQANEAIRSASINQTAKYVDITALFGGDTLASTFTHDGLHLNARGLSILANVLFQGLARKTASAEC